MPKNLTICTL